MRAMIPHHSIAIMTSRRAHIRDPRDPAQVREIGEMNQFIGNLGGLPLLPTRRISRPV